jgi:hypothetical protein
MSEQVGQEAALQGGVENRLYVVLHGLVCLIEDPANDFTGYLINQGNVHVYMAGDFLLENPIPPKALLNLKGVNPGNKKLDSTKNAILAKTNPTRSRAVEQRRIVLPHPTDILHFVCGDVEGVLQDLEGELKTPPPTVISGTRVFQYSFTDYHDVCLVPDGSTKPFWQCPPPDMVGNLAVAILEVYNEPPHDMDQDLPGSAAIHNLQEFQDSLDFMQARSVTLLLPALDKEEHVCSLDIRDQVLAQRRKEVEKNDFIFRYGKMEGGAGGTQVCGGANGILG